MDSYMNELLQTFYDESAEIFEELENNLLELENNLDSDEIINKVFRSVHTLKGSANMMGLEKTGKLAHAYEDLLDKIRDGQKKISPDRVNLFFNTVDCLKSAIQAEMNNNPMPQNYGTLLETLKTEVTKTDKPLTKIETISFESLPAEIFDKLEPHKKLNKQLCLLTIEFEEKTTMKSAGVYLVQDALADIMDIIYTYPDSENPVLDQMREFNILGIEEDSIDEIVKSAIIPGITRRAEFELKSVDEVLESRKNTALKTEIAPAQSSEQATLRVDWQQLTSLMNYVEELYVGKSKLNLILSNLNEQKQDQHSGTDYLATLSSISRSINKLISSIQEQVMDIRRIPLEVEMNRFNRTIRDISVKTGQIYNLVLECNQLEIDRGIWEEITDSIQKVLTMIITRNSPVKGTGTIKIRAFYSGESILISLINLGQKTNVINEQKLSEINQSLKKLRGKFEVVERDNNIEYRFKFPANSSIVQVLLVDVDNETYAFEVSAISETVKFLKKDVKTLRGNPVITHKGKPIAIKSIEELPGKQLKGGNEIKEENLGIILAEGDNKIIFRVDKIIGEDNILIKELQSRGLKSEYMQGFTILGDGRIILILDHIPFLNMEKI
ncbi:MAG: Hpt domain-containing protein [Vulcanimicrobiota bacterium]